MKTSPILPISLAALALAAVAALCLGRYPIAPAVVSQTIAHRLGFAPNRAAARQMA